jgi:hypothetical protein
LVSFTFPQIFEPKNTLVKDLEEISNSNFASNEDMDGQEHANEDIYFQKFYHNLTRVIWNS